MEALAVRAVGRRGARSSQSHLVWVLPRSATATIRSGRSDPVLQRRLNDLSAGAGFVNGIYVRNLATGCGAAGAVRSTATAAGSLGADALPAASSAITR
mgnify:CR=1 FL=1